MLTNPAEIMTRYISGYFPGNYFITDAVFNSSELNYVIILKVSLGTWHCIIGVSQNLLQVKIVGINKAYFEKN